MVKEFENYNSDSELELFSDSDNDSLEDFQYNFGMLNVENEDEHHKFGMGDHITKQKIANKMEELQEHGGVPLELGFINEHGQVKAAEAAAAEARGWKEVANWRKTYGVVEAIAIKNCSNIWFKAYKEFHLTLDLLSPENIAMKERVENFFIPPQTWTDKEIEDNKKACKDFSVNIIRKYFWEIMGPLTGIREEEAGDVGEVGGGAMDVGEVGGGAMDVEEEGGGGAMDVGDTRERILERLWNSNKVQVNLVENMKVLILIREINPNCLMRFAFRVSQFKSYMNQPAHREHQKLMDSFLWLFGWMYRAWSSAKLAFRVINLLWVAGFSGLTGPLKVMGYLGGGVLTSAWGDYFLLLSSVVWMYWRYLYGKNLLPLKRNDHRAIEGAQEAEGGGLAKEAAADDVHAAPLDAQVNEENGDKLMEAANESFFIYYISQMTLIPGWFLDSMRMIPFFMDKLKVAIYDLASVLKNALVIIKDFIMTMMIDKVQERWDAFRRFFSGVKSSLLGDEWDRSDAFCALFQGQFILSENYKFKLAVRDSTACNAMFKKQGWWKRTGQQYAKLGGVKRTKWGIDSESECKQLKFKMKEKCRNTISAKIEEYIRDHNCTNPPCTGVPEAELNNIVHTFIEQNKWYSVSKSYTYFIKEYGQTIVNYIGARVNTILEQYAKQAAGPLQPQHVAAELRAAASQHRAPIFTDEVNNNINELNTQIEGLIKNFQVFFTIAFSIYLDNTRGLGLRRFFNKRAKTDVELARSRVESTFTPQPPEEHEKYDQLTINMAVNLCDYILRGMNNLENIQKKLTNIGGDGGSAQIVCEGYQLMESNHPNVVEVIRFPGIHIPLYWPNFADAAAAGGQGYNWVITQQSKMPFKYTLLSYLMDEHAAGGGGARKRSLVYGMGNRVYLVTVPNDGHEVVMVRKGNEVLVEETSMNNVLSMI